MTEYIHDRTDVEVTRYVNLVDGPVRPQPYSSAGRRYRVDRVQIKFTLGEGAAWRAVSVTLSGTVLKKDGTDSKNDARDHAYGWDDSGTTPDLHWLRDLVDRIRPIGRPTLPFDVLQTPNGN
jgi:hypothetical protein